MYFVSVMMVLTAKQNIHMDYGILGSSDLDQASPFVAKLEMNLLVPIIYPMIRDGKFKNRLLQKRMKHSMEKNGDYGKAFVEMLGGVRPFVTKQSCKNQFYPVLRRKPRPT